MLTDASGAVVTRYAFDAWGKRRDVDWTAYTTGESFLWQSHPVTRGYTFHEQLDPVDLVHMNGRVYDPTIGRFLSADPFVQDVTNTQALNAYSYVLNNPLSYTDPSGFFFSKIFKAIGNAFQAIGRAFMHAVRAIVRSSIGRAILQIVACANPAAAITCAPAAAGLVLAAGGTLKEALISAALSFAQVGTSVGGAIDIWGQVGDFAQRTGLGLVGKALTHGVVAGSLSMAQGGSFESGFFSGALSAGVGGVAGEFGVQDFGSRTVISVVVGGTTSVLSGGKFANGAVTAAFATMFNDMQHGSPGTQSGIDERAFEARTEGDGIHQSYILEELAATVAAPLFMGARAAVAAGELIAGSSARYIVTDGLSDAAFTKLVKDVSTNGFRNNIIKYVQVGGDRYIVNGNNRYLAARQLGRLGELKFQRVQLPVPGTNYNNVGDLAPLMKVPRYRGK